MPVSPIPMHQLPYYSAMNALAWERCAVVYTRQARDLESNRRASKSDRVTARSLHDRAAYARTKCALWRDVERAVS